MVQGSNEDVDLWWLGAFIYVVGSILINLGSNMIRKGHEVVKHLEIKPKWYENYWWSGGFGIFGVGNVLNFIAFMFAAQSLLVSLGSIQFIANFFFARYINKEKASRESLISVAVIIVGIVLVVMFGSKTSRLFDIKELFQLLKTWDFLVWIIVESIIIIILQGSYLFILQHWEPKLKLVGETLPPFIEQTYLPLAYSIVSVCAGTQSILLGKMLSGIVLLTLEPPHSKSMLTIWPYFIGLLWLITSAFYIHRLNLALKMYDALFIIPTLQGLWLFFGALEGGIYFRELAIMPWSEVGVFCVGLLLIVIGVMVLAAKKRVPPESDIQFLESVSNVDTDAHFFDLVTADRVTIRLSERESDNLLDPGLREINAEGRPSSVKLPEAPFGSERLTGVGSSGPEIELKNPSDGSASEEMMVDLDPDWARGRGYIYAPP